MDSRFRRKVLRLGRCGRRAGVVLALLGATAASAASALEPAATQSSPWLDAPLGYLLRTEDEFPPEAALFLRAAGQLSGSALAVEIADIRKVGFTAAALGALEPLFASDLKLFTAAREPEEPAAESPPLKRPEPRPPGADASRPALPSACLERAARCELEPGCVASATGERSAAPPEQAAFWLLIARWRGCPTPFDPGAVASRLAGRLIAEQRRDSGLSTTALLRLATLGQLGYADRFEPDWIRRVLDARTPAGCWGSAPGAACHPHPTALALWVLALAERAERIP